MALDLGFCVRDLFILVPDARVPDRWPGRRQHHARKVHSYLLVLQRPDARYSRLLARTPPRSASRRVRDRRAKVAQLAAGGATQRAIAAQLGTSQSTVRDDVSWLRRRGQG
jgi:DNA-binding NarL/FixJ family response regulator